MARNTPLRFTPLERFLAKIEVQGAAPGGCWLWTGARAGTGYAYMQRGRRGEGLVRAHRWSYEHFVGPIPEGLDLDHLCRVRHCVAPHHLEPVTRSENLYRKRLANAS